MGDHAFPAISWLISCFLSLDRSGYYLCEGSLQIEILLLALFDSDRFFFLIRTGFLVDFF
jgi:hypothetical protein